MENKNNDLLVVGERNLNMDGIIFDSKMVPGQVTAVGSGNDNLTGVNPGRKERTFPTADSSVLLGKLRNDRLTFGPSI